LPEPLRKLSRHKNKKARDQITTPPAGPDNVLPTPTDCNADTTKADSEPDESLKVANSVDTETLDGLAMAQFNVANTDTPVTESETDTDAELVVGDSVEAIQDKVDIMNLSETTTEQSVRDKALKNREYILKELISTEKAYIDDLAVIVDGYISEIRDPDSTILMPADLAGGKERMVFGNIEAIYEWHRE
jgi:RhoGEF domain